MAKGKEGGLPAGGSERKRGKEKGGKERKATPEGMRLRLAGLCSRSEQCEYDLRKKLMSAGLNPAEMESVIEFLKANRYLDDARYARAYANDKVRFSGWGRMKIRQGLMAKRISPDLIGEALDSISEEDYIGALKRVGIAKARSLDIISPEGRAAFFRHLASRGFESVLIIKLADAIARKLKGL